MSEHSFRLLEAIKERLHATARRRSLIEMTFGVVVLVGIIAGLWLFATAIEAGFWMQASVRTATFWTLIIAFAGILGWFVVRPMLKWLGVLRGPGQEGIAKDVGNAFPEISDKLTNLLHLAEGRRSAAPDGFVDHAVQSLSEDIRSVEFEKMEDFSPAMRASRLASLPLVGILLFVIAAPSTFRDASMRLLSPATEFQRPAAFQINVNPGSVELIRGDSLRLEIDLTGTNLPQTITLETQNEGEDIVNRDELIADENGQFVWTFVNVRRSFEYRLTSGRVATPRYSVEIVERPIIRSLQVSLRFPNYAKIPPQRLEANVGDVQALPGTQVSLDVSVGGRNVTDAFVQHSSGKLDTLAMSGNQALGAFTLRQEGFYQIILRDAQGIENSSPIKYSLKLLPDGTPTVVLLEPAPLTDLNETLQAFLRARITDDFGFARLRLYYKLSETRFGNVMPDFEHIEIPLQTKSELDQEVFYDWSLKDSKPLDLVPGDVVDYYLQVWDNDSFAGYKSTASATHQLRLPSLAEQYKALDEEEDKAENEMEDLLEETQQVREQFEELRDELRNKQESDWEDQRQLEQLKEKQAELEERVEDLSSSFESMTEQMEENNLVSDETLEMYQEMQQVLEEINSPELMEALQQLQDSLEDLNLEQMQESLENFEFSEDQYQQRLERTLELFKQLRVQQDLEEVAKRAEDLAKQQEKMQEETEALKDEGEEGEQNEGEQNEGEPKEGEQNEGEQNEGEPTEGEPKEGEQNEGEQNKGEQNQGEQQQGEQNEGEQNKGEQNEGEQNQGEQQQGKKQEQLAKKQELSKEEMQQLEEQMKEIQEKMEELKNAPAQQMQDLNEQVEQENIPQQMQENAEQLRQNQLDQAQQQQQQMQQQLQQMQQQMQQMQQGMQGQQMQINIAGLRRALSDILTLSQLQEDLREDVRGLIADSPMMRPNAQKQVELSEGLTVVSDSLQKLAAKIPQMSREVQQHAGDALREMGSSVEAMTDRVPNRASGHQKESMMHLNELALLLSDLLNEMMNSQSGSGGGGMSMQQMIQQLQQAAGQQQQLNQQIQQMLNEMQGNRLSQDMQERLRQMASQQEQIRSQIKSLSRQRELRGKVMGDLNRMADQMEETIRELQRARPNRRTVERQQKILTRMLDATKSLQERGKEKKREGKAGEERFRESPADLTPSEEADMLRRALIEALETGYSSDYEELIKRYFELLQERSLEEQ